MYMGQTFARNWIVLQYRYIVIYVIHRSARGVETPSLYLKGSSRSARTSWASLVTSKASIIRAGRISPESSPFRPIRLDLHGCRLLNPLSLIFPLIRAHQDLTADHHRASCRWRSRQAPHHPRSTPRCATHRSPLPSPLTFRNSVQGWVDSRSPAMTHTTRRWVRGSPWTHPTCSSVPRAVSYPTFHAITHKGRMRSGG